MDKFDNFANVNYSSEDKTTKKNDPGKSVAERDLEKLLVNKNKAPLRERRNSNSKSSTPVERKKEKHPDEDETIVNSVTNTIKSIFSGSDESKKLDLITAILMRKQEFEKELSEHMGGDLKGLEYAKLDKLDVESLERLDRNIKILIDTQKIKENGIQRIEFGILSIESILNSPPVKALHGKNFENLHAVFVRATTDDPEARKILTNFIIDHAAWFRSNSTLDLLLLIVKLATVVADLNNKLSKNKDTSK